MTEISKANRSARLRQPERLNPHSVVGRAVIASRRLRGYLVGRTIGWLAPINDYERKISSQNGEDGIVAEIFRRMGTTNRFFVEFGVEDGSECNTAQLALGGWRGLMIEGNAEFHARLAQRYSGFANVRATRSFVTAENIASLFSAAGVPAEFEVLSIDIDGNDYWVWRALSGYRPRLVVIEYNAAFPPPQRWVMQYNPEHRWDGTDYYGASLSSLAAAGNDLGYALIGTDGMGVNAFFLRRDVRRRAKFRELPPERAYHPLRHIGLSGQLGHEHRSGPNLEI